MLKTLALLITCYVVIYPVALIGQGSDGCIEVVVGAPVSKDSLPYGRVADPRIAYMTMGKYVCRWHLERRNPKAANSDVVHPIAYVIDKDVPVKWQPYLIQAVKAWLPVFDSIGFHNAMTVRVASDTETDSALDATHVVMLRMTANENATANTNCWARSKTGEILKCEVDIHSGLVEGAGQLLAVFGVGKDPNIPLPLPDSMIGQLLQSVVAHEVGHTLGLDHNFHAPRAYPTDSLRSAAFIHKWGFTPSIMIWRAYDEVSQPEDHIPYSDRWIRIGPYDRWAIAWAYRPIPGATTTESELPTLERWRSAQDTASYLRIQVNDPKIERTDPAYAWGGDDYIRAIEFWVRNMVRLSRRLAMRQGTLASPSVAKTDLSPEVRRSADSVIIVGWRWRLNLVTLMLGGVVPQPPYQIGHIDTIPVPVARQLQALRFVLGSAFYGQDSLVSQQRNLTKQSLSQGAPQLGSSKGQSSAMDSLPIIFGTDTSDASRSAFSGYWQNAQHEVLEKLVSAVQSIPAEGRAEACRYLTDAISALTRIENGSSPALQDKAKALHTTLSYPFTRTDGCSVH